MDIPSLAQEVEQRFTEVSANSDPHRLSIDSIHPAPTHERRIVLRGSPDVSIVVSADGQSLTFNARDGRLVTFPKELIAFGEVRAFVGQNGEATSVVRFDAPVRVTSVAQGEANLFEISGALNAREWDLSPPLLRLMHELQKPRTTTMLGDSFRAIGTLVDLTVGVVFEEPKLSDEELIRRLSAEVVNLREQIALHSQPKQKPKISGNK